jgi:hypothetical protein
MAKRGRTSAAALAVAPAVLERVERPDAPYDLTDAEAEEWWAVVNRMPADWFPRETHPLLAQYCRHRVQSQRVAKLIIDMLADKEGFAIKDYDRLLRMQERESRALASLATKMRLSQQTTYDKSRKKGEIGPRKPWEG